MTRRSPLGVLVLSIITFGIYTIFWDVWTKNEMNAKGAQIPTVWLQLVPIANYIWWWRFSEGVELVTNRGMSATTAFLLVLFLNVIGLAIIQSSLNKVAT
jgi:hypothetical protein